MSRPAQASLTRLEEIAGSANVLSDPAEIASRQVDGFCPSVVVQPSDALQIAEILRFAASERFAVTPCGSGTKLGIGSPPLRYDIALDLSRLNRIQAYDPQDLTLGVDPGVRIEDLSHALAEQKQFLPLAVPFSDRATIGGIVAANSSSPLRHAYGGVRDFCLGIEFVTGEGVIAKSGGRVVKNVTGYDLHKLLIGSLGTLAIITRVNFRTFPLPLEQGMFVVTFSDAQAAFGFCRAIAHSVLKPQIVEVADPGATHMLFSADTPARIESNVWTVIILSAGQREVVDRYAHELGHMARSASASEFVSVSDAESLPILYRIREFPRLILETAPNAAIFRIGILPTAIAEMAVELAMLAAQSHFDLITLTRASGILYAAVLPKEGDGLDRDAMAQTIKGAFDICGKPEINASPILEWCPAEVKKAVGSVWGPPRQDFALMKRVKNAFDPRGVLSPGRFAGGI